MTAMVQRIRILAVAAAAAAMAGALTGCGVQPQSEPRAATPPPGAGARTLPSADPGHGALHEKLYLVKDGSLVAVTRRTSTTPTVDEIVTDLLSGPTDAEQADGISSALLGDNLVGPVHVTAGQASVELTAPSDGTVRNDEFLAYAQLVCTLTARPQINSVVFTRAGQPIAVPRADGSLSSGPLTAADYADLLPK